MPSALPPKPRLTLNIGVTGHRSERLPGDTPAALSDRLEETLANLRDAVATLHRAEPDVFSSGKAEFRLHTGIASGSDQLAADCARRAAFEVEAILPFSRTEYANDFSHPRERQAYLRQLELATRIFALPCDRQDGAAAYGAASRAIVSASDLLLAVWDGGAGRGLGGTADTVHVALRSGVPVIHLPVLPEAPFVGAAKLLLPQPRAATVALPLEVEAEYEPLVAAILGPPSSVQQKDELLSFLGETEKRLNPRLEYPMLLAATGVKPLSRSSWRQPSIAEETQQEWDRANRNMADAGNRFAAGLNVLERAYGWSNHLAVRYAQLFRSGHVANYALSALAVVLALSGLLVPAIKFQLVIAELFAIGLLFLNTVSGRRGEWHRKWLQYRHLAESLRPLPYLKRTGLGRMPFRAKVTAAFQGERGSSLPWSQWYASAIWRQMPGPSRDLAKEAMSRLASQAVEDQIKPQAAYHKLTASRMHTLDHRLHALGNALMLVVVGTCLVFLAGYTFFHEWTVVRTAWFVAVTAGLPAIGAAVFGLRGHGEFQLAASRSAATAALLDGHAEHLASTQTLEALTLELEAVAATMLADLEEWTLAYKDRSLEIPA